ncbi:CRP-like cAMP-binding protein [Bradyrhizobium sp. S3.3.6]|uniref:Crp/Fnr family transcriptional regulator n=2 Tax=Bradyrhizobium TaxID=374 RepID=A0A5S4W7W7_9BRAD|nr:Crp/Fnr family transcriptional regulator [Bradyrhizobium cytisi]TYL77415.1 Crp/Fnr family transcriptional regulator [Bradyrhizobium cytisi]
MPTAPLANSLLASLPRAEFEQLRPQMTVLSLAQGKVLAEVGDEIDQVYFPFGGMISLLTIMRNGKAVETATIGKDGAFGASATFGLHKSQVRAIIQISTTAAVIPAASMRRHGETSKALQLMCLRSNENLLAQARVTAACNALHLIEERFCRWLLQTSSVTQNMTIHLTQEFLSEMLGVRRTSVTEVAQKLQEAGLINYSRGVINILDLNALKARSCECFETLREQNVI